MRIVLKHHVIGGHLLCNVTPLKAYELQEEKLFAGSIIDDTGKKILISETCMRKHFRLPKENI